MIANEVHDYKAEKLLYQQYFDISMLKSRVEAASPLERAKCKNQLRSLLDEYKLVEAQVGAMREPGDEIRTEEIRMANNGLQELQDDLDSVGHWIWIQTA